VHHELTIYTDSRSTAPEWRPWIFFSGLPKKCHNLCRPSTSNAMYK